MRRIFLIGLLLVGALVAFSKSGKPTFAEQREKVLAAKGIFPDSQLWHDYGAFGLYRVSAETLQSLPPATRASVQTSAQLDTLNLTALTFDTQRDPVDIGTTRTATTETGHKLSIVQFVGPIKQVWLDTLIADGIRPIHYVSQNAYLVWADDAGRAILQTETGRAEIIQYVIDYQPAFKLDHLLRRDSQNRDAIPVTVQLIQHVESAETMQLIAEMAQARLVWQPILQFQNADLTLSRSQIDQLLQRPDVFWIGERLQPTLYDEVQAQIIAGNLDAGQDGPANTGYLAWLDGLGFSRNSADYPIVDIVDDGIGNGSAVNGAGDPTLTALGDGTTSRLAYVANCTDAPTGEGVDGHGHININIAGGYDQRSGFPFRDPLGYQRGQGINPYGRIAGTRIFDPNFSLSKCGGTYSGLLKSQQDNGALISSNSWGADNNGGYDTMAQAFDVAVRDADLSEAGNQAMIALVAAGNTGSGAATVGSPATAKNVIAVGASESDRPNDEDGSWLDGCGTGASGADSAMDIIGFSSRGPAQGNRVKPDIVAPGTHVQGTASTNGSYNGAGVCDPYRPSSQTTFAASSGTSHSTPAVAGTLSLYYHWLENNYALTPSPAMMKAYLIAHPAYLTGVSANDTLPSNAQGYGMPDMTTAFDDTTRQLVDQTITFDNAGETWKFSGQVADPSKPVRVVLAWTDAPAALSGDPDVNNLNLELAVAGVSYRGNVFNGQWSATGGSFDGVNNVEAIYLPAGISGAISVTVTAANIAGDGVPNSGDGTDQDFALVCYNCIENADFALTASPDMITSCVATDAIYPIGVGSVGNFADPVTLAVQLPANALGNFSTNPVTPSGTSQLTVDTQDMTAGVYAFPLTGTASSIQHTTTLTLALDDAAPTITTLQTPVHNVIDQSLFPTLTWNDTGADSYQVELATDAAFATIIDSATIETTNYSVTTQLDPNTRYYWRVRGVNGCGVGGDSAEFSFRTASIACTVYPSSNVPLSIPTDAATITSTLNIASSGDIVDLNVRDLTGNHSAVGNLTFVVVSPLETRVELVSNICGNNNDFAFTLDDEAISSTLPCPPTDGGTYRPISPLSQFDSQSLTGEWSLVITDSIAFDGGSLNSWGLEICSTVPAPDPDFSLVVAPNSAEICLPESSTHTINIVPISEFSDTVTLAASGLPSGVSAEFDQTTVTNSTTLTLTTAQGAPAGEQLLTITGNAPTTMHTTTLSLTLADGLPPTTILTSPANGATGVGTTPTFTWDNSVGADAYLFELATDPSFSALITSTRITANQFTLPDELALNEVYYWRVTPSNVCGSATASVSNFVTQAGSLVCESSVDFEVGIPADWVVGGVGGVDWVGSDSAECNNLGNLTGGNDLSACVNRDRLGASAFTYDSILTTNTFDLSTSQTATVTVKTYFRENRFEAGDGFAIERYDGTQWVALLNVDDMTIDAETLTLVVPNSTTQLRFRYYGEAWDYYAQIDDVMLTCLPAGQVTAVEVKAIKTTQSPLLILLTISAILTVLALRYVVRGRLLE